MRRVIVSALAALAFATGAMAQSYDLYYVLPGEAGSKGIEAGIAAADVGSIGDVGVVNLGGKYSLSDQIEVGALAELGLLNDALSTLSTITAGAKYSMGEDMALTAGLLIPTGDADDPGLSLGVMKTITSGDLMINNWLQIGLLDGATGGVGVNVDLLIEPTKAFGDKITGYLDILVSTNTDDIAGDHLGIDIGPNADISISDAAVVNVGVTLGAVGDAKADDLGIIATLVMGL
ncbi:MAG TPA: hypothetical protein QGF95_26060 [Candidatus Latescibacteria bacterium]|nr:hypothetical protein [Candidatus Latescibacterota bacterium]HJP34028.1 hypothetical protein [Candidatus Latescibacterota bacterium]